MAKPRKALTQRQRRKIVKENIAAIIDKHVSAAFNEAAYMAGDEGAPRSSMDFMRWFSTALIGRASVYPKLPPRRSTARQ